MLDSAPTAQGRGDAAPPLLETPGPPVVVRAEHHWFRLASTVVIDDVMARVHHRECCPGQLLAITGRQLRSLHAAPGGYQLVQIDNRYPPPMRVAQSQPDVERLTDVWVNACAG